VTLFLEETGGLLGAVTFVLFGAVMLVPVLDDLSGAVVLYAILSLTLVRMVPVALAMLGSDARPPSVAFLGWFGPRGLASIVFAVILVEDANLVHESVLLNTIFLTVALSVLLHGLTATPLAARYAAWFAAHPRHAVPAFEAVPARHQRPHRWGRADHPSGDRRGHHRAGGLEAPRWPVVAGPSPARPSTTQWASRRSRSAERSGE
jgi:NhaP-type Na+/H+ or K+/H+ antiporter